MGVQNEFSIIVNSDDSGMRVDALVALRMSNCSRSLAADLIRKGGITVQGAVKKPSYKVAAGEVITGVIPEPEPICYLPEPIPLEVLYEDSHILIINKPAGLVVHPAPGHLSGTLVNALLHCCPELEGIGGKIRPGIVHRLDKDTSGVLVIAKTASAQNRLSDQFKLRTIQKTYLAVVYGFMDLDSGVILLPVGRHPVDRKRMSTQSRYGRNAETLWKVRERLNHATWLEVTLKTGRTHQIRVHCAAIHHPILGDDVYGSRHMEKFCQSLHIPIPRQMLHAWTLGFAHPHTGSFMTVEAPIPDDMKQVVQSMRYPIQKVC